MATIDPVSGAVESRDLGEDVGYSLAGDDAGGQRR
jgi:hypothetical protein